MGRRARVYVTQETEHDFSGAEAWGEVLFITADDFNNNGNSIVNKRLMTDIRAVVKNYDPDLDWIVIAGSPYVAAAVFAIVGEDNPWASGLQLLRWDNRDRVYRPLRIPFGFWATNVVE